MKADSNAEPSKAANTTATHQQVHTDPKIVENSYATKSYLNSADDLTHVNLDDKQYNLQARSDEFLSGGHPPVSAGA